MESLVKVFGCGALNRDLIFEVEELEALKKIDDRVFPGAEVKLERNEFLKLLKEVEKIGNCVFEGGGGSAANTIYALSNWGFNTGFVGIVGEDEEGKKIYDELEKAGVDLSLVFKKGTTSIALIVLDKRKDRFIAVSPGTGENYLPEFISEVLKSSEALKSQFHFTSFASEQGKNFQLSLLENLRSKIFFDPGEIYCRRGRKFLLPWLKKTDYLFITRQEVKFIGGVLYREFFNLGIKAVFLKMGSRGAVVITPKEEIYHPGLKVDKVIDNTGAGDYFNAGVIAGTLLGLKLECILRLANYCAGQSLRDYARRGCISKEEFKNQLNLLK
ncbi:MAG: hypothetical protein GXO57_05295 [Thermodesulfobacteria bacterium]|nr:hypothetical protein [Thermodesulfobacteriota bacterium]